MVLAPLLLIYHVLTDYYRKCLAILQGHTSLVGQLQLRGDTLVTGGSDGSVRVWSLQTYTPIHRLAAHDNSVTSLQFDDSRIVSGGSDGRVKVWDLARGQLVRELGQPAEAVWRVVFEDEKAVVLASRGGKTVMEVWSFAPPEDAFETRRYGSPNPATAMLLGTERSATVSPALSDVPFSEPATSPMPMRDEEVVGAPLRPSGSRGEHAAAEDQAHYYDDMAPSSSRRDDEGSQERGRYPADVVMSDGLGEDVAGSAGLMAMAVDQEDHAMVVSPRPAAESMAERRQGRVLLFERGE